MLQVYTAKDKLGREVEFEWNESREPTEADIEKVFSAAKSETKPSFMEGVFKSWERMGQMAQDPTEMLKLGISTLPLGIPKFLQFRKMAETVRAAKEAERLRPVGELFKTVAITPEEAAKVTLGTVRPGMIAKPVTELSEAEKFRAPVVTPKPAPSTLSFEEVTPKTPPKYKIKEMEIATRKMTKVGETIPVTEFESLQREAAAGITRLEQLAGAKLPPPEPPDISDILKTSPPKVEPPNFLKRQIKGVRDLFDRPYEIMFEEPTGAGEKIWRITDETYRKKSIYASAFRTEFIKNVKISPNTPSAVKLGSYLDRFGSWEEIPAIETMSISAKKRVLNPDAIGFTPEEKQAYLWMRSKWNEIGDLLESKQLLMPDRRIKSYFFRIFDKEDIYNAWLKEKELIRGKLYSKGLEAEASAKLKETLDRIDKSIETYNKTGTILYDYLPTEFTTPFLKPRTGAKGYELDAVRAMNTYEYYLTRQLFDKDVIKESVSLMQGMHPYYKRYTHDYLRRYAGMDKGSELREMERVATNLVLLNTMGFNPRSALVNATQHLNTIADIGFEYTIKGGYKALFDTEARAAWDASGHGVEVPSLYFGQVAKGWSKVNQVAMKMFDKVELGNRMTAWLGARAKGLEQGLSESSAITLADDVLRRTQGVYGVTGSPMIVNKPFGAITTQFTSFPLIQLNLFKHWAKENPAKLIAYLLIANGTREGLKEIGVDLSNALGTGMDEDQLIRALWSLHEKKYSEAWIHTKLGLPKLPLLPFENRGSGMLPSGFAPVWTYLQDAMAGEWRKILPAQGNRMWQSAAALLEGEVESGEGKKGYPVRPFLEKTLLHVETPLQLFSRTFLARPTAESGAAPIRETIGSIISKGELPEERGEKAALMKKMLDEVRREKTVKAAKLFLSGKNKESEEIISKYGLSGDAVANGVEAEFMRRKFTSEERMKLNIWMDQGIMRYKMGISMPPPNMP